MRTRLLASLLCLTALAACSQDNPPGSLIVPFTIGADIGCTALGVEQVKVDLWSMPAEGAMGTMVDSATVSCSDGQAEFTNLAAGRYEVRAAGTDAEGIVIVDNGGKANPDTSPAPRAPPTTST